MPQEWHIHEAKPGGPVSHQLVFEDDVALDRADLVAEAVEFLQTLPGVIDVEHAEEEVIVIAADAVPTSQLTEAMRRWWEVAKQEKRPWMAAVDRAAGIVSDLIAAHGYQRHGYQRHGYQRHGWELIRVLDAELTHVIILDHRFHWGKHWLTVTADIRLPQWQAQMGEAETFLPQLQKTVADYSGGLDADGELAEAITGRLLPALDALPSVDAMLDRWQNEQSIKEEGRYSHYPSELRLHARVLVSRGRLTEAQQVYQKDFEHCRPDQRPYLLELAAGQGVPPLTTASNPHLSVTEEATLAAWLANTDSMVDQLRCVTGLRLNGSRRSVDQLWAWLRDSRDRLQTTFAAATPVLGASFYGVLTRIDIQYGRVPFEPWYAVTVELVTAYLGRVVTRRAPGTAWGIGANGELAMARHGGTGLLSSVYYTISHEAFDPPADQFKPHKLRWLVDNMVQRVNDKKYPAWVVRLGVPGP
jgi:hypothetical protein